MSDEPRLAVTSRLVDYPLRDEETRKFLIGEGFDLEAPISWRDDPSTNCRHYTQDRGRLVSVPHFGLIR